MNELSIMNSPSFTPKWCTQQPIAGAYSKLVAIERITWDNTFLKVKIYTHPQSMPKKSWWFFPISNSHHQWHQSTPKRTAILGAPCHHCWWQWRIFMATCTKFTPITVSWITVEQVNLWDYWKQAIKMIDANTNISYLFDRGNTAHTIRVRCSMKRCPDEQGA